LSYPILKNVINSNDSVNENLYKKVFLKNFVISSKSIQDKYFILKNNKIEVNKIIKHLNEQIYLIVTPLNYCIMYQDFISSCLIKSFYINNNNHNSSKLIDLDCLKNKCLYILAGSKSIAIALLHEL